ANNAVWSMNRGYAVLPAYEKLYKNSAEKHDTLLSRCSSDIKLLKDKRALLKQLKPQKKYELGDKIMANKENLIIVCLLQACISCLEEIRRVYLALKKCYVEAHALRLMQENSVTYGDAHDIFNRMSPGRVGINVMDCLDMLAEADSLLIYKYCKALRTMFYADEHVLKVLRNGIRLQLL
ncbi:hypothetical protein Tco_1411659, partial [Tanacetum coccineum]